MYFKFLYSIFLATECYCVKVDMQGTLSLGKDVMQTIARFLGNDHPSGNFRRSLTPIQEDKITEMVKLSVLCRDLDYCHGELRKFVDEFIIIQAKGIENVLSALLNDNFNSDIYEEKLKHTLGYIRFILKEENVSEKDHTDIWIDTVKKISAKFQEMSLQCMTEFTNNEKTIDKAINHKVILASVIIEMKYLHKLCSVHDICVARYECSAGLNTILEHLKTMKEEKTRLFIKYLYEALYKTQLYSYLSEMTAHEFQVILNDMAYSSKVPAQDLLSVVQRVVGARVKFVTDNTDDKLSHHGLVVHVILSDLDNIYSSKSNPFAEFLNNFIVWTVRDENYDISKYIRTLLFEMSKELSNIPHELFDKLSREIRIFLEMTVDPEL